MDKAELRKKYLSIRNALSEGRRDHAAFEILERLKGRGRILSFYSIGSEINLAPLNSFLVEKTSLAAFHLEAGTLHPYYVEREDELVLSKLGILEPNPMTATRVPLSEIDLILVPAIVFDSHGDRIGYGGGHYDKFLCKAGNIPTVGIGFREQLSTQPFPKDPWDVRVKELLLV
jgi:5-formyltetrahydrofolate cyclo-ligase